MEKSTQSTKTSVPSTSTFGNETVIWSGQLKGIENWESGGKPNTPTVVGEEDTKTETTMNSSPTPVRRAAEDRLRRDRKYKAFWAVFLMGSTALFWDKLSGDQYVNLVWPVFGLFMAGNVGEHWTRQKGDK